MVRHPSLAGYDKARCVEVVQAILSSLGPVFDLHDGRPSDGGACPSTIKVEQIFLTSPVVENFNFWGIPSSLGDV